LFIDVESSKKVIARQNTQDKTQMKNQAMGRRIRKGSKVLFVSYVSKDIREQILAKSLSSELTQIRIAEGNQSNSYC
jgi:hypothetical protein